MCFNSEVKDVKLRYDKYVKNPGCCSNLACIDVSLCSR